MSYVKHVLQPEEKILVDGRISWVIYHRAIFSAIIALAFLAFRYKFDDSSLAWLGLGGAAIFGFLALISFIHAWFLRFTTEIAVTNKRIIYKRGLITRHTAEMNMDKVASVDVDQSLLGRVFNYGSIQILGTGGARGIERLSMVHSPLALRNAIDVR
jgi:uncharacterized membrane protein YdbT with pleckstrin-like domain